MEAGTVTDSELNIFLSHRRLLFSVAYRMMGSVSDAEDIVQESYLRWRKASASPNRVRNAKALLVSIVTRLCLDEWKRARRKREVYVGPFLPEPVPTAFLVSSPDDDGRIDQAFMLLLEQLKPVERAVFILREAFDYSYSEIATIVQRSEAACRQIFSRARRSIDPDRKPAPVTRTQELLLQKYVTALSNADAKMLLSAFQEDIQLQSDGGGVVNSARRMLKGRVAVAALLLSGIRKDQPGLVYRASVNGMPAFVVYQGERPVNVHCLEIRGEIQGIYGILNPAKLSAFADRERLLAEGILKPMKFSLLSQLRWLWYRKFGQPLTAPVLRQIEDALSSSVQT